MNALQLAGWLAAALVAAYAVWAARDVILKRQNRDERMDALEKTCKNAIENLGKQMGELSQRVAHLEGNKSGAELVAQQNWKR